MLGVGSGSHGEQAARVIERLEPVLRDERARPGARARRRQLDPGRRALRRPERSPGRPRRVRPAQLRSRDARGDQPDRHRPPLRLSASSTPTRRSTTSATRASPTSAQRFVGNTMIDTLVALEDRFRARGAAAAARPRAGRVPARHAPPPGAGRRPAARRRDAQPRRRSPRSCRSSSRSTRAPGSALSRARLERGGARRQPLAIRSAISTSSRWRPTRARC